MAEPEFTILLVDDEPLILNLAAQILETAGYRVLVASQSEDALVLLDEFPGTVHVLMTDVHMGPYLNGFELAKCSRILRPGITVLYFSGIQSNAMITQEVEEGRAYFLLKPFTPQALIETVGTALHLTQQAK